MSTEVFNLVAQDETKFNTENRMNRRIKTELKREYKSFPKKRARKEDDLLPDIVKLDEKRLEKHLTDIVKLEPKNMKTGFHKNKMAKRKKSLLKGIEKTARAEIINEEESGYLETEGECSYDVRQSDIVRSVDIASAAKNFQLSLPQFGPYRTDYSTNGRYLALGGRKGHVAAVDWQTKRLLFETNVMERVRDVQFLHTETMLAVAQKNYTHIYDHTGTELHCLKEMFEAERLEFLPHHFLLVAATRRSWLHWLDVSVGKMVKSLCTRTCPLQVVTHNAANAIIHTGHTNGTVCLWAPNVSEPLVQMLAHPCAVKGIAVDATGTYMYTTALDLKLRVWDVRQCKMLHAYSLPGGLGELAVSHNKMVASGVRNSVQVFRDTHLGTSTSPYLVDRFSGPVSSLDFVPYEDVLGVGHHSGFSSLLVPGCGEANVDALRNNPYETKKQRREREVKQLLDKLPSELISLDPMDINRVNTSLLEEEIEKKKSIVWLKAPDIQFTPRHKTKGRGGGVKKSKNKESVKAAHRLQHNLEKAAMHKELFHKPADPAAPAKPKSVLDRFRK